MVPRNWWTTIEASAEAALEFWDGKPYKLGMLSNALISPRANYFNQSTLLTLKFGKKMMLI